MSSSGGSPPVVGSFSHGFPEHIRIVSQEHSLPFSKGILSESLTATGLPPQRAYAVAQLVEGSLRRRESLEIALDDLRSLVMASLAENEEPLFVDRYQKWQELTASNRPLIIVIGGATGVGKSTLASQVAARLGIVRLISTDTIRQVMRAFFSSTLMPSIHCSSFDAEKAVRVPLDKTADPRVLGFVEQVRMVNAGVEAVVTRAVKEGLRMVVEGVHIVPGFMPSLADSPALIMQLIVAVTDEASHRSHFLLRERQTEGRRPNRRYVRHFHDIRRIQEFILALAGEQGTLVVENEDIDSAVGTVVDALYARLGETGTGASIAAAC